MPYLLLVILAISSSGWRVVVPEELNMYLQDRDNDGISDGEEIDLGLDPYFRDTDGDGFTDLEEVRHGRYFGYDPRSFTLDTDLDGLSDSIERVLGTNPQTIDSDGDGFSDLDEHLVRSLGYDPLSYTREDEEMKREILLKSKSGFLEEYLQETQGRVPLVSCIPEKDYLLTFIEEGRIKPSLGILSLAFCFYDSLYYTYHEMVDSLSEIYKRNPDITQLFLFSPPTYDGHRIWAMKVSDNPRQNEDEIEVLYVGNHHARELISVEAAMDWIEHLIEGYRKGEPQASYIVEEREIWVIPMLNPDGHSMCEKNFNWRKNTHWYPDYGQDYEFRGVDLNRNYPDGWEENPDPNSIYWSGPHPLSEREDSSVFLLSTNRDLVDHFSYSLAWHSWLQGEGGHQYSWILTPNIPETRDMRMKIGTAESYRTSISNFPRPPYQFFWEYSNGTHEAYQIQSNKTKAFLIELFGVQTEGDSELCFPFPCDTGITVCDTLINPLTSLTYNRVMMNSRALSGMKASFLKGVIKKDLVIRGEVYLTGDILIPDSVSLTLEPGTKVLFIPGLDERKGGSDTLRTEVIVYGNLTALGEEDAKIEFFSFSESPSDSDWLGIEVFPGGNIDLQNVHISNSLYGVYSQGGTVSLVNTEIEDNREMGVFSSGVLSVEGCSLSNNGRIAIFSSMGPVDISGSKILTSGDCGLSLFSTGEGSTVSGNQIIGDGGEVGIFALLVDSTTLISFNVIQGLRSTGISMRKSSPGVFSNIITGNGPFGILLDGSSPLIKENLISGFDVGLKAFNGSRPKVGERNNLENPGFNSFSSFSQYALEYFSQVPEDSLLAENNYWGSPKPLPSFFLGRVDYIPWLEKDPFGSPPVSFEGEGLLIRRYLLLTPQEDFPLEVKIFDISGRLVKRKRIGKRGLERAPLRLDLKGLRGGIYFYLLEGVKGKKEKRAFIYLP